MKRLLPLPTNFGLIRRALAADIDRIVQLVSHLAKHHGDIPSLTHDDLARDLFSENPWIYIVVAEMDGEIIGYAAMCRVVQLQFGARGMDMHHLFTEAAFRNQGVGQNLIKACKIQAAMLSCSFLMVGTHPNNQKAQAFYTSLGFERRENQGARFSVRIAS